MLQNPFTISASGVEEASIVERDFVEEVLALDKSSSDGALIDSYASSALRMLQDAAANNTNGSNGTNGTGPAEAVCNTQCCKHIRKVVKQLCMEYQTFQMDDAKCRLWVDVTEEVCLNNCGECDPM